MIARCPKNENHKEFTTSAHVVQDWKVDEHGNFLEEINSAVEVTHGPNKDNVWECDVCGETAIVDED